MEGIEDAVRGNGGSAGEAEERVRALAAEIEALSWAAKEKLGGADVFRYSRLIEDLQALVRRVEQTSRLTSA